MQEALYGGLHEPLREEYHALIGDTIERREGAADTDLDELEGALSVSLCDHFLRSKDPERGRRYLKRALDDLWSGALLSESVALIQRALAVPGMLVGEERFHLLGRLAYWLNMSGRRAEEKTTVEEALELADQLGDARARCRAHRMASTYHNSAVQLDESLRHGEEAIRLAREIDDRAAEGHAARALGLVCHNRNEDDRALEWNELALGVARERDDRGSEAAVSSNQGTVLFALGRTDEAEAAYRHAIRLAREEGERRWEAAATMNLGGVYHVRHDFAGAMAQARRAYELSSAIGDRRGEMASIIGAGLTQARLGALEPARSAFERARALAVELADPDIAAYALNGLGDVAEKRGELDAAEAHHLAAIDSIRTERGRTHEANARLALLRIARTRGDDEGVREQLEHREALERMRPTEVLSLCYRVTLDESELPHALELLDEGNHGAETLMQAHFVIWQATQDPAHLAEAHRQYEQLRDDAPDEYREMQTSLPLYRAVAAAWEEQEG